jgi:16S rRNA (uracil1498-N3)-methyltransferase
VPRLFLPAHLITEGRARLTGAYLRHARALRLRPGERLTVLDDDGREHDAIVAGLGPRGGELEIRATTYLPCSVAPPITLVAGILKGPRMDVLVEKATELGVARIVPALAERTVARPAAGQRERPERWRRIAVSAATQCGRPRIPIVDAPIPLAAALGCAPDGALRLLFWEEERGVTLATVRTESPTPSSLTLVVGPEGGFTRGEVETARAAGFAVTGLGPRTLRAETAGIVALALAQSLWGDLR